MFFLLSLISTSTLKGARSQTHHEQLRHVWKGCLACPREDIVTDGSCIEGMHKGWNALQRTHPSGVEVLMALMADHVLRHNIRVDHANATPYLFTTSTFGSHHIALIDACTQLWNKLFDPANRGQKRPPADLLPMPTLQPTTSKETFSLVKANSDVTSYHSLIMVKEEQDDLLLNLTAEDPEEAEQIMNLLGLDLSLLHKPLEQDHSTVPVGTPSGRSAIAFVSTAMETQDITEIDASGLQDPPASRPSLPSTVPVCFPLPMPLMDVLIVFTGEPEETSGIHHSVTCTQGLQCAAEHQ